jgi:POT family proton-dependent oligopeptide transporter
VSQDPHLVSMYAGLAIVGIVAGCTFFVCFRKGRKCSANAVILEAIPVESNSHDAEYGNTSDMSRV